MDLAIVKIENRDEIEPFTFVSKKRGRDAKKSERRMDLRCSTCDNVCNNNYYYLEGISILWITGHR